jgi:putative addiction module killer protein
MNERELVLEYVIKMYKTALGKCPFDEWMNALSDKRAQVAIDLRLERVKKGNFGNCKSVGGTVYELKIDVGPGYRAYFGKVGLKIVLLLCAGDKRSQQRDIEKAKKYLQDFKKSGMLI